MSLVPYSVIARQVLKPLNPTSGGEQVREVVAIPGGAVNDVPAPGSLRDAIEQASAAAAHGGAAIGVFQSMDGALSLTALGRTTAGGIEPLRFEAGPGMPIGGPYTDRFERTPLGAGRADAPALQAIVGATTFASFTEGETSDLQPIAGPVGIEL